MSSELISDEQYKKRITAWAMYDWANSAFATTIMSAVLPIYFSQVAGAYLPSAAKATQYWSATLSISVFLVAIISPILGTVSDVMRGKKKFLAIFMGLGIVGTGLLALVSTGDWILAAILFVVGRVGFGSSIVFYDSLLGHVAKEEDQDWVSTRGYALGYLGGGILLAINIAMILMMPDDFIFAEHAPTRLSFITVALWWAVFSIPLLRHVPEPVSAVAKLKKGESIIRVSFARMKQTLKDISGYPDLFKFLISFLIYNDGIGIIISVAAIYVAELGFGTIEAIMAILLVQFVGIPYSILFGNLPSKGNKWQPMLVAFVVFNIVSLPIAGILAGKMLPKEITGTPSANFPAQGDHLFSDGSFQTVGVWMEESIAGDLRGQSCAWYQSSCEESAFDLIYAHSDEAGSSYSFPFTGQEIELKYSVGPDHGIWLIEMDGAPLLNDEGEAVTLDGYSLAMRYDEHKKFEAAVEGNHILTVKNGGDRNEESMGNRMSVAGVEILPPKRTSNLLAIIGLILVMQLVAAVFAYLTGNRFFSGFADSLDTRRAIMLALSAYAVISIWGYFLNSVVEFWFLAWMVAIVQGGSQGLSRSLYASMTPTAMSGEFFGFFSIMSKFASFLSPIVFIISVQMFDSSRPGVLSLIFFFAIGMYLLNQVNIVEGRRVAKEKNELILSGSGH